LRNRSPLALIFLTVFIDLLGFGILIPILPTFATKELGVDETAIGFAIAVYSLTQFFFNPIFGKLSDKYGRRPLIVISLFLNAIGYIIFAFTHSYLMLLISRVIAGIGGSSIGVAQAYIADVTTKSERSKGMGLIGAAFGLGFVFGPLIGGILSNYGYMITGFGSASFSMLAFILTLFLLPESNLNRGNSQTNKFKLIDIGSFKKIMRNTSLIWMLVIFFILTFSIANIYGTFALLGYKVYHFSDQQNAYMYTLMGLTSVIVQGGLLNLLSKYLNRKQLTILGTFLMAVGLAVMPFGQTFLGLAVVVVILSIGTGTLQPTILGLISEATPEIEQGITLGVNQSFSALARVLGPIWGGFAFEFLGYPFPFLTGALFTFIIFILSLSFIWKRVSHEF
jgi:multidrug resistance protein